MKLLETAPNRYDRGIRLITFGRDLKVKKLIVNRYISEKDYVLDIGTGTGTLAALCAEKGAKVFAFDKSEKMLSIAKEKVKRLNLGDRVTLETMSVVEMDKRFEDETFDKVVAALIFSELSEPELDYALKQIQRVLKKGGLLIVEDEVRPSNFFKKLLFYIIRIPLKIITYIVSQSTTKPVKNIEVKLEKFDFKIIDKKLFFLDSLMLLVARKEGEEVG